MKTCSICNAVKESELFYRRNTNDRNKNKLKSACISCSTEKARKKFKLTYTPGSQRDGNLRRTFGITLVEYEELLKHQQNKCAICSRERKTEEKNFAVDHDHLTGAVRGILCGTCNTAIGQLNDSKELLNKAIKYLEKYE